MNEVHVVQTVADAAVLLVGYPMLVFGGGWLVGLLLAKAGMAEQGTKASLYIGWFERALIVTLVLAGDLTSVGFAVAAKSLLRFGESQKDKQFAEYVLLGTLASVTLAVAGGLVMRHLLTIW